MHVCMYVRMHARIRRLLRNNSQSVRTALYGLVVLIEEHARGLRAEIVDRFNSVGHELHRDVVGYCVGWLVGRVVVAGVACDVTLCSDLT
jgi:hypothetical protein